MPWLSRLFGGEAKTTNVAAASNEKGEDDTYSLVWRNKYLAARIEHLDKKLEKKQFGGITAFDVPEDTQTGTLERLKTLNETLTARVEYLEGLLKGR